MGFFVSQVKILVKLNFELLKTPDNPNLKKVEATMKTIPNLLTNISKYITISLALGLSLFTPKILLAEQLPSPSNSILSKEIYFYGKSPVRDQLGVEYLIFLVQNNKLVGAFYQISSEFNCFYGKVSQEQISLAVIDPYDNTISPYAIALESSSNLASESNNLVKELTLSGYHEIKEYNNHDLEMLNICQQELQNKI